MCLYEEDQGCSWGPCSSQTLPPEKVPFQCTMCGAQKLSAKTTKKHKKEKHPSSKLNVAMMFTGTKQRVEFTSEQVYEVPAEPKINDVDKSEQVPEKPQKRRVSPKPEEPNRAKVRRVLDFDVVSPPTSPTTQMNLPPTPKDHSNRAQHLIMPMTPVSPSQTAKQTHHPPMRVPHQQQVTPSKVAVL